MSELFQSVFPKNPNHLTLMIVVVTLGVSLILGLISSLAYQYRTIYTKQFVVSLAVLPTLIAIIIFLVNGRLGASVAVAGTFSLIRFRSAQGGSKELIAIFTATAIGIAVGMGYLTFATCFTLLLSLISIGFEWSKFGQHTRTRRQLVIKTPTFLDYDEQIIPILNHYCSQVDLQTISNNKKGQINLTYQIDLATVEQERKLVEEIMALQTPIEVKISHAPSKPKVL